MSIKICYCFSFNEDGLNRLINFWILNVRDVELIEIDQELLNFISQLNLPLGCEYQPILIKIITY